MKTPVLLLLLTALPAFAEEVCLTNLGRIRVRTACRPAPYERPFKLGAKALSVVDRDGELVGTVIPESVSEVTGATPVLRFLADHAVARIEMTATGMPSPLGSSIRFSEAGCQGNALTPSYDPEPLLPYNPAVNGALWVPVGPAQETSVRSELHNLGGGFDEASCVNDGGGMVIGQACCFTYAAYIATNRVAQPFRLSDAGLEPPFRLSLE